ncbi:MAG TPA: sigma-70 family RNA polymerase sigma factor [Acidimicrobiales bacterium]|nr:sigma-70 family RNA polymerase sigma factor [Acidimicrobiales bacterium]
MNVTDRVDPDPRRPAAGGDPAAWVKAAADGDAEAWNQLVNRFDGLVWAVARSFRLDRASAADVVQTTWLRLVEHLSRIENGERVGAWLATTARRECLAATRRNARREITTLPPDLPDDRTPAPDGALLRGERDRAIWAALGRLSDRCQQLLRLLAADPAPSYEEVSAALSMPVGSIGPTRGRCLERLRRIVTGDAPSLGAM